jgi:hypothetical protein
MSRAHSGFESEAGFGLIKDQTRIGLKSLYRFRGDLMRSALKIVVSVALVQLIGAVAPVFAKQQLVRGARLAVASR